MFNAFKKSMTIQIILQYALIAIIPLVTLFLFTSYYSSRALQDAAFKHLQSVKEIKAEVLKNYIDENIRDITYFSSQNETKKNVSNLMSYYYRNQNSLDSLSYFSTNDFITIKNKIDQYSQKYFDSYDFKNLIMITPESGYVTYALNSVSFLGKSLLNIRTKNSNFFELWASVIKDRRVLLSDIFLNDITGKACAYIGMPVLNNRNEIQTVLVLELNLSIIDKIMQERSGLGKTGETYLVGNDYLMRSDSRFDSLSSTLRKVVRTEATMDIFERDMKSVDGKIIKDYRGKDVLSSSSHIGLNEFYGVNFDWAILAEIDKEEAFSAIGKTTRGMLKVGLLLIFLAIIAGYLFAYQTVRKIKHLIKTLSCIAEGDLSIIIKEHGEDEIGNLLKMIKKMVDNLKEMFGIVSDTANKTNSSTNRISASIEEQVTVATQLASSVAEITSTMEEISASSSEIAEYSSSVAESAQKTLDNTTGGTNSVSVVMEKMQEVKEDNLKSTQKIIDLGKKSEEITNVMDIINNIADQTKLIAFNAALEASSAGEAGKRFGVVASEIRRLADNVMESTGEIEKKINEIQHAVNNLVVASETGAKGIQVGLDYSVNAAKQLEDILIDVQNNADAAKKISLSIQQQKIANEQVVMAAREIAQGTNQTTTSMNEINKISQDNEVLSKNLLKQISQFKLSEDS